MTFDWKSYLIPAATVLLVWYLLTELGTLREEIGMANGKIRQLEESAKAMRDAVDRQNAAVAGLAAAAVAEEVAAGARAEKIQAALPSLIKQDRAAGTAPKEMNQWLESLFSLP